MDSHRIEYRAVIPKLRQGLRVGIIKIPLSPRFSLRCTIRVAACVPIVMNFHGAVIMEFLRCSIVETNRPNSLFLMGIMEIVLQVKKVVSALCDRLFLFPPDAHVQFKLLCAKLFCYFTER